MRRPRILSNEALLLIAACVLVRPAPYPSEALAFRPLASTRVLDRYGVVLHEARSETGGYGAWLDRKDLPDDVVLATLSSEDADFYRHGGIDPRGIVRAIALDLEAGRLAYGGSTITQQLAKLLSGSRPRTVGAKLAEAVDAIRLEHTLDKDAILTQYLNRVYYGRGASGIEAAAQRFYGKPAALLTLDEAALLAILPRAPSAYDPERHPARAMRRRAHVLEVMAERGFVSHAEASEAAARPIAIAARTSHTREAPHALDMLVAAGVTATGELHTTLDAALQHAIEQAVDAHLSGLADRQATQAAVVVLDNASGEVLAIVGSRDYDDAGAHGAVNGAIARRSPGSALKPFVYALALEAGANPATPVLDAELSYRDYRPRSLDGTHHGLVSLRDALGSSLNTPAIQLAADARRGDRRGPAALEAVLREVGLVDGAVADTHGLALALGSAPVRLIDLAAAYAAIARGGTWMPARFVRDRHAQERRVMSESTAFLLADMLSDGSARRLEFGPETPLDFPFAVAAKTGTSQGFCDNVTVGFSSERTVAVWTGRFDGRPMRSLLAMDGAAPLFRASMLAAMRDRVGRAFTPPHDVHRAEVCPLSGLLRGPHCPRGRSEWVAHEPDACTWHDAHGVSMPGVAIADPSVRALRADHGLEIVSPEDASAFAIDPLLPRDVQRMRIHVASHEPSAQRARLEIDGREVARGPLPLIAFVPLERGEHALRAIASSERGELIDTATVRVADPNDVLARASGEDRWNR